MKDDRISDQCIYEQLSEDWRNRDRITWQLPSVLVVVSGVLIASVFGRFGLERDIGNWVLWLGSIFAWILAIMLARNIYLQAVGQRLLTGIQKETYLAEVRKSSKRVPDRIGEYTFWKMLSDFSKTKSSLLLLLFSILVVGLFFFFLESFSLCWFGIGLIFPLVSVCLCLIISHKFPNLWFIIIFLAIVVFWLVIPPIPN